LITDTEVSASASPLVAHPRVSHAVLLTASQLSRGLLRLLFVLAAARELGPGRFGVYTLLLAMVEMLAVASGSGYVDYLTREAAKDERLGWGLAAQLIWLRLAYMIPFTGVGLGIVWLLGYPRLVLVATACMSLTLLPRSLSEAVQGVLRGIGRYVEFVVVELVFGLMLAGGAGVLLARGGGLRVVIATELAATAAAAGAGLVFAVRFRTRVRLRLKASQLFKTSAIFNISTFAVNLYDRLDVLMLSKLAGDYATGVYGVAYRPIATMQLLPYGVLYSLLPALSRGGCAQPEQRERLEKAMGLLLSAAFVIVLATMVFADALVPLLLGSRFAESAAALKILIWAVILRYLNYALNMRLLAGGHERVFVATSLTCLAVNFIGNLVFIPIFSWRAAAVLTVMTELALLAQNVYWVRRAVGAVPRPLGWARISLVFVVLLLATFAGGRVVSPLSIGSGCLFFFLIYLYRTGMVGEFAAAWRTEPGRPA
jgi:O-antigen/teichoic acid export membrane protein